MAEPGALSRPGRRYQSDPRPQFDRDDDPYRLSSRRLAGSARRRHILCPAGRAAVHADSLDLCQIRHVARRAALPDGRKARRSGSHSRRSVAAGENGLKTQGGRADAHRSRHHRHRSRACRLPRRARDLVADRGRPAGDGRPAGNGRLERCRSPVALPALPDGRNALPWADLSPASALKWAALLAVAAAPALTLGALGLFFLKVGSVLYGSGYVLVAFLEGELVHEYGWLTQQQLLDAIAIGQFTPGPVLSTAAFIGYVLAGVPGAFISAAAIFAPSFLFVAILNPIVPRLRRSAWMAAFLDAVNVSAVGLMAAVLLRLSGDIVTAWPAAVIALLAAAAVLRWRVTSAWVVIGGALLGWPLSLLG